MNGGLEVLVFALARTKGFQRSKPNRLLRRNLSVERPSPLRGGCRTRSLKSGLAPTFARRQPISLLPPIPSMSRSCLTHSSASTPPWESRTGCAWMIMTAVPRAARRRSVPPSTRTRLRERRGARLRPALAAPCPAVGRPGRHGTHAGRPAPADRAARFRLGHHPCASGATRPRRTRRLPHPRLPIAQRRNRFAGRRCGGRHRAHSALTRVGWRPGRSL